MILSHLKVCECSHPYTLISMLIFKAFFKSVFFFILNVVNNFDECYHHHHHHHHRHHCHQFFLLRSVTYCSTIWKRRWVASVNSIIRRSYSCMPPQFFIHVLFLGPGLDSLQDVFLGEGGFWTVLARAEWNLTVLNS